MPIDFTNNALDRSRQSNAIHRKTEYMRAELAKKTAIRLEVSISRKGVPHIVGRIPGREKFSVCWFGSNKMWRFFYPYGTRQQAKTDCKGLPEIVAALDRLMP